MSTRPVTFYKAVCDVDGEVHEHMEFGAWADADEAVEQAANDGWIELEVRLSGWPEKYDSIRIDTGEKFRSILLCGKHSGDGVEWCATCEDDLQENKWRLSENGDRVTQTCAAGHESVIILAGGER